MQRFIKKKLEQEKCPEHDEKLSIYCCKCKTVNCQECLVDKHYNHRHKLITDCYHNEEKEITNMLNKVEKQHTEIKEAVEAIRSDENEMAQKADDMKEEISTVAEKIISDVREEMNCLIEQVERGKQHTMELLCELRERGEERLRQTEKVMKIVRNRLRDSSKSTVLREKQTLLRSMDPTDNNEIKLHLIEHKIELKVSFVPESLPDSPRIGQVHVGDQSFMHKNTYLSSRTLKASMVATLVLVVPLLIVIIFSFYPHIAQIFMDFILLFSALLLLLVCCYYFCGDFIWHTFTRCFSTVIVLFLIAIALHSFFNIRFKQYQY